MRYCAHGTHRGSISSHRALLPNPTRQCHARQPAGPERDLVRRRAQLQMAWPPQAVWELAHDLYTHEPVGEHRGSAALSVLIFLPLPCKKGSGRLSFTTRMERGPFEGARSASKKDSCLLPYAFFSPILLSVPFRNRSIFPLCFIAISPLTVREKSMNGMDGWISAAMTGKRPKAVSAPPEE